MHERTTSAPWRSHALVLLAFGRIRESVSEARRAAELDPFGISVYVLGEALQLAGDLEESEATFRRHLAARPESILTRFELARTLLLRRKSHDAAELFASIEDPLFQLQGLAMTEHALGHDAASDARLKEFVERYGGSYPFQVAETHAWRGERGLALTSLAKSVAANDMDEADRWSPFLHDLRDDPEFKAIVRRLNLPMDNAH